MSTLQPSTCFWHTDREGVRTRAFDAGEFWRWGFSKVQENVLRGILAEFIVARAVEAEVGVRNAFDETDLVTPSGIKLEVKSTGYVQAWHEDRGAERVRFGGLKSRAADVYVLCVHTARSRAAYDPLDLDQWEFWVVARRTLERLGSQKLGYGQLRALAYAPVPYVGLRARIERVYREARLAIGGIRGAGASRSAPPPRSSSA